MAVGLGEIWWSFRLQTHPKMRLTPSEVRSLTMLEVVQRHAFLDWLDAEAEERAAKAKRG